MRNVGLVLCCALLALSWMGCGDSEEPVVAEQAVARPAAQATASFGDSFNFSGRWLSESDQGTVVLELNDDNTGRVIFSDSNAEFPIQSWQVDILGHRRFVRLRIERRLTLPFDYEGPDNLRASSTLVLRDGQPATIDAWSDWERQ